MKYLNLLLLTALAACAAPLSESPRTELQQKRGILVMAHGGDAMWNARVDAAVAPLREQLPIEIAFGMARTSTMREAVHKLESQGVGEIAVVRMFASGDSFLENTEVILGLREPPHSQAMPASHGHMEAPERIASTATFLLSRNGVAESPLINEILHDRVRALSRDPSKESILILAHGPGDEAENERWLANMRLRAQSVHELGPFRHVQCETLREDWPERRAEAERRIRAYVVAANQNGGRAIVIPFRIAGFGPYRSVLEGLNYASSGSGFCPHPNMTKWIEATAEECFEATRASDAQ